MIARLHGRLVRELLGEYPAVALIGPRQCGKTTLARSLGGAYLDMEREAAALQLDARWEALTKGPDLLILDEAQAEPGIFPRLRGAIDEDRGRNGRFLLLGSVSPALAKQVSESLAGRLAFAELTPFVFPELKAGSVDDLWLFGGYPDGGILGRSPRLGRWQDNYLQALAMRDLPNWGLPSRPRETLRLMKMLAAVHGQAWNASQLGASLGVDYKTVNSHLEYLEGAFLIRRLAPYSTNIGKRLIKSPKVYWRDSGLVHALLGVRDFEHLLQQPWAGASWEGFVIEQTLNVLQAAGLGHEAFFLRTSDNHEVDLLLKLDRELWAVEIKLTSNPSRSDMERVRKLAKAIGAVRTVLVCRINRKIEGNGVLVTHLADWLKHLPGTGRAA